MRALAALVSAVLLAGCASTPPPASCPHLPASAGPTIPDPPPPVSGTRLTLAPAHWEWAGDTYVWEQAVWVPRTGDHPQWMPGFWTPDRGACVWNKPHFLAR